MTAPARPEAPRIWRGLHSHTCPNCGADERPVVSRDRYTSRGDLICRDCGYAVGACAARCLRAASPLPGGKEKT